jgi:hypothetical protein
MLTERGYRRGSLWRAREDPTDRIGVAVTSPDDQEREEAKPKRREKGKKRGRLCCLCEM